MEWESVLVVLVVMLVPISIAACITFAYVMRPVAARLAELVEIQHRALADPSRAEPSRPDPALVARIDRLEQRLEQRLESTEAP